MEKQVFMQISSENQPSYVYCLKPNNDDFTWLTWLSFDLITKEIQQKIKNGAERFYINGQEPLRHPDILKIIKYIKKSGVNNIDLFTFGAPLEEMELVKKLKNVGLTTVHFYLHDIILETDKATAKERKSFQKVTKALNNCFSQNIGVFIFHIIYENNYQSLPEFIDFLKNNYPHINYLNLNLVDPEGRMFFAEEIIFDYSKLKKYLEEAIKKCKEWGVMFNFSGNIPLCLIKGNEECSMSSMNLAGKFKGKNPEIKKNENNFNKAPQCKKCTVNDICSGFYEKYGEIYGYNSLKPYTEKIENILVKFPNYKK